MERKAAGAETLPDSTQLKLYLVPYTHFLRGLEGAHMDGVIDGPSDFNRLPFF